MNPYYKPYIREVLTDAGIVVTDGPNDEYVKTVPNDDKVTKLLREAISLWRNGNKEALLALYSDKNRRKEFTTEESFVFKCAVFGEPATCLSEIVDNIYIEEDRSVGTD